MTDADDSEETTLMPAPSPGIDEEITSGGNLGKDATAE